jgi:hypothetical protein
MTNSNPAGGRSLPPEFAPAFHHAAERDRAVDQARQDAIISTDAFVSQPSPDPNVGNAHGDNPSHQGKTNG